MGIDWNTVRPEHISSACEVLTASTVRHRVKSGGIVVSYKDAVLPAKDVLREAYRLANGLPRTAKITFASGEGTINLLRKLGFPAGRHKPTDASGDE